jgi:hypothetical protein
MAKLSKADTARHLKISRQTLYQWIQKGRISVGSNGFIDSSEVARLSSGVRQPDVIYERHHGQEVTSPEGDTTRELIEVLKAQLADAKAREQVLLDQIDRLTSIIDRRLLEAPRPSPPAEVPMPSPPSAISGHFSPQTLPDTWQQILTYMQQHPGPQRPKDVQRALGWIQPVRHVMRRMADTGLLCRAQAGVYVVMEAQHHA